jgi:HlyD family secretion protein
MIPSTSTMDRVVAQPRGLSRRNVILMIAGAALLVAIAAAVPALRRWSGAERSVEASRVRLASVSRGDLERDVSAQGRVVAALHPTLFSPAQGHVVLAVKAGTEVKKGDLLASVESPDLRSRLTQERATLLSLQGELGRQQVGARSAILRSRQTVEVLSVRLAAAQRARDRAQSLFEEGLLNKTDNEKAKDDAEVAGLELKNAKETAELEKETLDIELRNRQALVARQQALVTEMQRLTDGLALVAPFDGMVATVDVQDRDAVNANQPVLTVVDLSKFEIEFDMPENYASDVAPGTRAEIQYEGRTWPGRVTVVSPEVKDSQVRGTVVFEGEQPAGLRQSQRVSTRILLEHRPGVLKLPRGAFLESGGGRLAWVQEDGGLLVKRSIETGATSVSEVEVLKGLREGERVVVSDTSIFEGARRVLLR